MFHCTDVFLPASFLALLNGLDLFLIIALAYCFTSTKVDRFKSAKAFRNSLFLILFYSFFPSMTLLLILCKLRFVCLRSGGLVFLPLCTCRYVGSHGTLVRLDCLSQHWCLLNPSKREILFFLLDPHHTNLQLLPALLFFSPSFESLSSALIPFLDIYLR